MGLSVFLKDYIENLKEKELKKFYDKLKDKFVIDSINDYLMVVDILLNEKEKDRNALLKDYYFRGVSNERWELLPSLTVNNLEYYESIMIEEFKKAYPSEFDMKDTFDVIAKMQHYGLPTRLLDFTTNPLVSLYFACSDIQQNQSDGKVIVSLPVKNVYDGLDKYRDVIYTAHEPDFLLGHFSENAGNLYTYLNMVYIPNSLFFKVPSYITEREKRQSSIFMLFANSIYDVEKGNCITDEEAAYLILKGLDYYKKHYGNQDSVFKLHYTLKRLSEKQYKSNFVEIVIPARHKENLLKQLSNMGIRRNFLFPEMEYTAEYIKRKYILAENKIIKNKFCDDYDL